MYTSKIVLSLLGHERGQKDGKDTKNRRMNCDLFLKVYRIHDIIFKNIQENEIRGDIMFRLTIIASIAFFRKNEKTQI